MVELEPRDPRLCVPERSPVVAGGPDHNLARPPVQRTDYDPVEERRAGAQVFMHPSA